MTATATQPPPPPPPPPARGPAGGATSGVAAVGSRQSDQGSTRRFLDRWLWRLPLLLSLMAAACVYWTFSAQQSAQAVAEIEAPALIGLQNVLGNAAEANAAATSAHLSVRVEGSEDRGSRGLYEAAVNRALSAAVATAATGVSWDGIDNVATSISKYSTEIEAARLANLNGLPGSDSMLAAAVSSVEADVEPTVRELSSVGQAGINQRVADAGASLSYALIAAVLTLVIAAIVQRSLALRTRRIFNRYLLLATVALVAVMAAIGWSMYARSVVLTDALDNGYAAVTATGELQSDAFALQASLSTLPLGNRAIDGPGDPATMRAITEIATLIEQVDAGVAAVATRADSAREQAAATTLESRWTRYRATAESILDATNSPISETAQGEADAASLVRGQGLADFNGFNTAIESVLLDNRVQFRDGVGRARNIVEFLPWIVLALSALAALLSVAGIQQRRQDYQ